MNFHFKQKQPVLLFIYTVACNSRWDSLGTVLLNTGSMGSSTESRLRGTVLSKAGGMLQPTEGG